VQKKVSVIIYQDRLVGIKIGDFEMEQGPKEAVERLDPQSYTPLYVQLFQIMRDKIEAGTYQPGQQLPSERELIETYEVSRITATAAIQKLVHSGLAYRIRGKGSFVARPKIRGLSSFGSFSDDIRARGMVPSSRTISSDIITADDDVKEHLQLEADEKVLKISRLRFANDEPVALETAYIPEALFPGIENEDLEHGSLYEMMENKFGQFPTWSEGVFEAAAADDGEAELLDLEPGDPVLWVHRVTRNPNYTPIEWVHSLYRADRFSFSMGILSVRSQEESITRRG
jgi:GntR family transcriptional regulator